MENVADALKIAFGIFVFVIAITMLFMMVSKAKSTADVVLYYSDNTNFHEHTDSSNTNRSVGISEVVATLYRYYNESVAVTVKLDDEIYVFDKGNENTILIKNEDNSEITKLKDNQDIERNLGQFITEKINTLPSNTTFSEEFTEVPTSGIYVTGSDGSEITLSSGGKKVYITYTKM